MKVTKQNIKSANIGYIGTIVEKRFGRTSLLNMCYKGHNEIKVDDGESQGLNYFTVDEFVKAYKNKKLQIL